MRVAALALLLAACAPPTPPSARLIEPADIAVPQQICSMSGEEALEFTLRDGTVLAPMATGERCDYGEWRLYRAAHHHNPPAPWRGQGYAAWSKRRT